MTDLVVNGRFLTRPLRGVNRVGSELISALIRLKASGDPAAPARLRVLTPPKILEESLPDDIAPLIERVGAKGGIRWEQATLPRAVGDAVLFNPCNTGPLLRRRQVTLIHDAQVWTAPQSYGRAFRAWYKLALPVLARRSGAVATVSANSRRELEGLGVFPKDRAAVLPNGADHILRVTPDDTTLERHELTGGGYVLSIGSLAPHKNIATAIRAAEAAGLTLAIAGGAPSHVFRDAGLPASDRVRYLGRVSDEELRALYESAGCLLFPSLREGFGLPPLEAMHCGCPVVASDIETLREVCGAGALMADPMDVAGFAAHLSALAKDPDLRARQVAAGRAQAALYTWDETARALMGLASGLEPGV
ncbi:MAG: glycosyltransferase family 1 protein [Pseudomonadota bacterium]